MRIHHLDQSAAVGGAVKERPSVVKTRYPAVAKASLEQQTPPPALVERQTIRQLATSEPTVNILLPQVMKSIRHTALRRYILG